MSESNNKYADLLELTGEVDGQEAAPFSHPFSATAGQIGNAIDNMVDQARKAGMLYEVIETYGDYRASGDNPLEAARCALYEWDC